MMAIVDSKKLTPECPVCSKPNTGFIYWFGAWVNGKNGVRQRVLLKPGETETIRCICSYCDHRWEEYVIGEKCANSSSSELKIES